MNKAGDMLKNNLAHIGRLASQGSLKHLCMLACFVVFVFIFLYYLFSKVH